MVLKNKVQGFLAVVVGLVITVCVITGIMKPYPSTWSWENARQFCSGLVFYAWLLVVAAYIPAHYWYMDEQLGKCDVFWLGRVHS